MKTESLNQILIKALEKYKEQEFAHVPGESEVSFSFSDEYVKKRNRISKNLNRSYWKLINTTVKKAAVIIISFIIAFSSLMTVDALREKIIDFIIRIYETFTVIEPETKEYRDVIADYYTLAEPVGFKKSGETLSEFHYSAFFINDEGLLISLTQNLSNAHITFDSEFETPVEETINGFPCLTCQNDVNYLCYWEVDGYRFELIYPEELGKSFMAEVVGRLVEFNPESVE